MCIRRHSVRTLNRLRHGSSDRCLVRASVASECMWVCAGHTADSRLHAYLCCPTDVVVAAIDCVVVYVDGSKSTSDIYVCNKRDGTHLFAPTYSSIYTLRAENRIRRAVVVVICDCVCVFSTVFTNLCHRHFSPIWIWTVGIGTHRAKENENCCC